MKSIVKTLFIGGVLFLGSNAIWAKGLVRCTCYKTTSDTVASCQAFSKNSGCDVVYIQAYTQKGDPWLKNNADPAYFTNAEKAAKSNGKKLGAMVSYNRSGLNFSDVNAELVKEEGRMGGKFDYSLIDLEQTGGNCPAPPSGEIAMNGTANMQFTVGNGTCEKAWINKNNITRKNETFMCYKSGGCHYTGKPSRKMVLKGQIGDDFFYPKS